ncbi:hypothetical protein BO78DRAFT_375519 [Aspergillus sclerotiicarbonarius CBS 121057]|uniref:Zn(2)-C6 fungal-type domain-containing protein n=1 Tax=Aspergillus sclerotiicarbonarius (strain CBS 121057 / IBT 28362) TaxID=1448318 RepID=A0A319EHL1_ASPSB|nr:hypothetical protein BO78DRAFT_375519 [Aspergillus sclerotiicarbonarius CBS 121057]
MATFKALFPPYSTPPPPPTGSPFPVIRDNLTLTTWLLLGGLLQGLACMALGPVSLTPTVLVLLYRTIDHVLMACHITPNRYLNGTIPTKYSAQVPNPDGTFGSKPASEPIVVFLLGARCNHPLGLLAPGISDLGDSASKMMDAMRAEPVKYGLLGTSQWLKMDSPAGNEFLTIFYLRSYEALHRFAHDEEHMNGMRWWCRIAKDHPHLAIYHETYLVPRGQWENIYINMHPTGLADTWFPGPNEGEGNPESVQQWVRPMVDARGGVLRSASKRLQLAHLEGREKEHDDIGRIRPTQPLSVVSGWIDSWPAYKFPRRLLFSSTAPEPNQPSLPPPMRSAPSSEFRQRQTRGKRSKAGCRTCRARHVKCDETPGACRNCTSTGRSCDGYDIQRLPAAGKSLVKLLGAPQITVDIRTGFRWAMTSDERRCFAYFQHHTVPTFREMFDSSLWQRLVLQMAQSDPAVYHAAVALSALHQDSEAKGMPLAADIPTHPDPWLCFAQEQLGRAFQILTRRRSSHDPRLRNITLLCCLLFVLSDLLRGQYDGAFVHLQSGLRILQELQAERELVAPTPREERVEQGLVAAFAHLDISSAHYGTGAPFLCIDTIPTDVYSHMESGVVFRSLREAHDALYLVISASYRFMVPCMGMTDEELAQNYGTILPQQLRICSKITHFWQSFEPFYRASYAHLSHKDRRSAEIIHIQYVGLLVSVKTCVLGRNEAAMACFTPDLEAVVTLAEGFLERYPDRPTVSVGCGIIAPMYHPALSCRDYRIRWRAIKVLRAWPHREGPFDSNWIASLAEEALRLEFLARPGASLDLSEAMGVSEDDEFSPTRILKEITERQRQTHVRRMASRGMEGNDPSNFPIEVLGSVKCVVGWSCMRAFMATYSTT